MSTAFTATRYHDISCGHRVAGHESKCAKLHGHNYRVHFYCEAKNLDHLGRVIDFSVIKQRLCMWIENVWDHNFLVWEEDPYLEAMLEMPGVVVVPFNPTAENMADYLLHTVGPSQLDGTPVRLYKVVIDETAKCSAVAELSDD